MSTATMYWRQVFERVEQEARTLTPLRVLLTLIAAPLFVLGWIVAWICKLVWLVFAWALTAVQVGWREAGGISARKRSGSG